MLLHNTVHIYCLPPVTIRPGASQEHIFVASFWSLSGLGVGANCTHRASVHLYALQAELKLPWCLLRSSALK